MKIVVLLLWVCLGCAFTVMAQTTFQVGFKTYMAGMMVHEYVYDCNRNDTSKLMLVDSSIILCTPDSLVTLTTRFPARGGGIYKTFKMCNDKKKVIKTEEYKDDFLQCADDWKYDNMEREQCHITDKAGNSNTRREYSYATDKKEGDMIVTESSYINGKIEFYTKSYYNKAKVKYKEVRLNDNNKDIVHVETYTYGENGKVKERSVYFPEWKVTRKFEEPDGNRLNKCIKYMPLGIAEKISLPTRIPFIKKVLARNVQTFADKDCTQFDFRFSNNVNCEIEVCNTASPSVSRITYRFKEKCH